MAEVSVCVLGVLQLECCPINLCQDKRKGSGGCCVFGNVDVEQVNDSIM